MESDECAAGYQALARTSTNKTGAWSSRNLPHAGSARPAIATGVIGMRQGRIGLTERYHSPVTPRHGRHTLGGAQAFDSGSDGPCLGKTGYRQT